MAISGCGELKFEGEAGEKLAQQKSQPPDQASEVVADCGEDGVGGIALAVPEIVAAHSMLGFEMADDGLDRGAPSQFAFDLGRHAPLLA
jgi:hypothetical protein